ncbi:hypothetical protein L2D14_01465 [Thalassospiraceae bacterium LMO-JJ14]|nr:hypothetical protein L2D14_01465 [Thalassospiraceae bacterium LMO-JJ14]
MTDHIQIGDVAPRINYTGDGVTTTYAYPFPVFAGPDLEVYVDGVLQILSTAYTVTGAGQSTGGTVIFAMPPDDGSVILILRRLTIARTSDFQASGEFRAKVINDELDFQTAVLQQINDDLGRTVRLQRTDAAAVLELPGAAARADGALTFDAEGDVTITAVADLGDVAVISQAVPSAGSSGGSAGSSGQLSAADHRHPFPALADIGIATQSEAEIGGDNTKAMTPLRTAQAIAKLFAGTDQLARDMAVSALAYAMAANDATVITGSVGKFWLSDDFESDSLATSLNATYDAAGDYYHNPSQALVAGGTGTVIGDMTLGGGLAAAFDGTTDKGYAAGAYKTVTSGALAYIGKDWGSGNTKTISKYVVYATNDVGYDRDGDGTQTFKLYGSTDNFSSSNVLLASNTIADANSAILTVDSGITTSSAYRYHRIEIDVNSPHGEACIAGVEFYETASPGDMTLTPSAVTLSTADPLDVIGYFTLEPVDSVTFGTDIVGKISIDGGTTKVTGTWTKVGDISADSQELWRLEADVSAESGASLVYEITTANSKQIRLHDCVGLIATY